MSKSSGIQQLVESYSDKPVSISTRPTTPINGKKQINGRKQEMRAVSATAHESSFAKEVDAMLDEVLPTEPLPLSDRPLTIDEEWYHGDDKIDPASESLFTMAANQSHSEKELILPSGVFKFEKRIISMKPSWAGYIFMMRLLTKLALEQQKLASELPLNNRERLVFEFKHRVLVELYCSNNENWVDVEIVREKLSSWKELQALKDDDLDIYDCFNEGVMEALNALGLKLY